MKHLRATTYKAQTPSSKLRRELKLNDDIIADFETIATKVTAYFSSIAQIINEHNDDVETNEPDKLRTFVNSKIPENASIKIPLITSKQVLSFIKKLDPAKVTGIDGIGPKIIKLTANVLSPSIAMLTNKSLSSGIFPSQFKLAKVFPIHKVGDNNYKTDPSNYRPISILPTASKMFERHVNQYLMGFLNKYKLIHENQSGFRQKHGCQKPW